MRLSQFSFSSVTQSCPTLCDLVNHSMPGLPVHHQLLEFTQTHVHWVGDAIQPSHPLSPLLLLPSIFPSIRVFSNESSGSHSIGVSVSTSVHPVNTQDLPAGKYVGSHLNLLCVRHSAQCFTDIISVQISSSVHHQIFTGFIKHLVGMGLILRVLLIPIS